MKLFDRVANGHGLVWRGMRASGRVSKNYFFDGCRTALFITKTALMAMLVIGTYLGYNTVTESDGYQMSFPTSTYTLLDVDSDEYSITTPDGDKTFISIGGSWVDETAEVVSDDFLVGFLNKCQVYHELTDADSSRNIAVPQASNTSWIPNGIEFVEAN